MKRIGIDAREFIGIYTGINCFLHNLLLIHQNINDANRDIEIILFGNQHTIIPKDLNYKLIKMREISTIYYDQVQLPIAIGKYNISNFFSPYPKTPVLSKIHKTIMIHDLTSFFVSQYKNTIKTKIYFKFLYNLYIQNTDRIIAASINTKNDIMNIFNIPENKISVIYQAVSDSFRPADKDSIKKIKNKYNLIKKYILYTGNSRPHKNLNSLIKAYQMLPKCIIEEYDLVFAGVNSLSFSSSVSDNIKMLGYINREELPKIYCGAELFVFPSLYEGFGFPPLEAMACNCPVISSNVSSMPEVLSDACLYFNPQDVKDISEKIKLLITNETLKNDLRKKGLQRAHLFNSEKMYKELIEVMTE